MIEGRVDLRVGKDTGSFCYAAEKVLQWMIKDKCYVMKRGIIRLREVRFRYSFY